MTRKRPRLPAWLLMIGCASLALAQEKDAEGKTIFVAQKCARCHAVSSEAIEADGPAAMRGPALDEGEERDADWLRRYLERSIEIDGKRHRVAWKGSEAELEALVAWLAKLERKPR